MNDVTLLGLIKPYRSMVVGAMLSLVVFTVMGMLSPLIIKVVIDKVFPSSNMVYLYVLAGSLLLIIAVRSIFFYVSHYMTFYIGQRILFDVRKKLFKHLQSLSLRFYEEYRTGKLISNVITDVALLQQMVSSTLLNVSINLFVVVMILASLFLMNTGIALICVVTVVAQFVNFNFFRKRTTASWKRLSEKMSEISANLSETINGIKVVKSFSTERAENRSFVSNLRPVIDMNMDANMKGVNCWIIAEVLNTLCTSVFLVYSGMLVVRQEISIGTFVAVYAYVGMLLGPISALSNLAGAISQGLAGAARVRRLLETIPEIREKDSARQVERLEGGIEFRDVSFAYEAGKPVIRNFSLKVSPGMKVAFVGPSGSGKSTIANLLLRFYDVNSGAVLVDGHDLRNLSAESYRRNVGVVLQEPFLFSGSIRDNIAYGLKDADGAAVERAARMANVAEFVDKLDKGYDTHIGENGASLSGGQKQRVAIARAILKNPGILILDEATSALDTVSEHLVQEALDNLMQGRTTVIIAHRLSTIKNADLIVVMEDGELRQAGSHDELIKVDGIYKRMYTGQIAKGLKESEGLCFVPATAA